MPKIRALPGISIALLIGCADREPPAKQAYSLQKVVELSSIEAPVVPSLAVSVVELANEGYVVSHEFTGGPQIVKYDITGKYVKVFEKIGRGPGELSRFPVITVSKDTIYALEGNRLTRIDGNLEPIDTRRLPFVAFARATVLPTGELVVDEHLGNAETINIVSADLRVRGGPDSVDSRIHFAARRSGGMWTIRANGRVLKVVRNDASLERLVSLKRSWLLAYDTTIRPRPANVGITELDDGSIAILTWVPEPGRRPSEQTGPMRLGNADASKLWDSVVEIVSAAGDSIGMAKSTSALRVVKGSQDHFYSTRTTVDGHVLVEIWKLTYGPRRDSN